MLYEFIDFLSFVYNNFTENAFFSEKKAPAGKCTHGKKCLRIFLFKKRPLRENAHTAQYFYAFFSKKRAPAGKCTHGKKNVLQWSLAAAQWSLAAAQWSLAAAQESKNTRKMVEFLYGRNPIRTNMAQPYRLIVWI